MKEIPLTRGYVALVDDEDYEWLMQWKWHPTKSTTGKTYYAVRSVLTTNGVSKVHMHNAIMGEDIGKTVDHIDHNGLNNQRSNLRFATASQQLANRSLSVNNTTGFKGVSQKRGKFRAQITASKTDFHIGTFATAEEAARAYDEKARELFGDFANTNF